MIDAMRCQKEIAQKILDQPADYVLAVKDNQPKLREVIHEVYSEHLEVDLRRVPHRQCATRDEGHGRNDERCYYLAKLPKDPPLRQQWPAVQAIGMALRITEHNDGRASDDVW